MRVSDHEICAHTVIWCGWCARQCDRLTLGQQLAALHCQGQSEEAAGWQMHAGFIRSKHLKREACELTGGKHLLLVLHSAIQLLLQKPNKCSRKYTWLGCTGGPVMRLAHPMRELPSWLHKVAGAQVIVL